MSTRKYLPTKMLLKEFDPEALHVPHQTRRSSAAERKSITDLLWKEMREIYYARNIPSI